MIFWTHIGYADIFMTEKDHKNKKLYQYLHFLFTYLMYDL